jgi:von Willebrand factor type A domain
MTRPLPATLAVVLVLSGAALAAPEPPPGILVSLETPTTHSRLLDTAYVVDVYAGMAVGSLMREYATEEDDDLAVSYRIASVPGFEFVRLDLESSSFLGALAFVPADEAEAAARASRERLVRLASDVSDGQARDELSRLSDSERRELLEHLRGVRKPPDDLEPAPPLRRLRSVPFPLESKELVTLRATFRANLAIDGRMFRLTLPQVWEAGVPELPIRVQVTIHHPTRLALVRSLTHQVLVDFVGDRTIVEPVERTIAGDDPFELEFALAAESQPTVAGFVREDKYGRRAIEAVVNPPERPMEEATRPKQVLFVVDSSRSMAAFDKLDQARRAVASSILALGPQDRFNVVEFDAGFRMMSPVPVALDTHTREQALTWLREIDTGSGTMLLPALTATLEQPVDSARHRMVLVVTDGMLQDERQTLDLLREKLADARLFVVGTGPDMGQETLLRLAAYGRGAAAFAGRPDQLEQVVELFDRISRPLGWDLTLDVEGAEVTDIVPSRLPDLYAGQPVRILAWVRGELPSSLRLRMSTMDGERLYNVALPPLAPLVATR